MKGKSGDWYANKAEKGGCRVQQGTNNNIVYPPEGEYPENEYPFMSIPRHRQLSPGVERKINKWLAALGILLLIAAAGVAFL